MRFVVDRRAANVNGDTYRNGRAVGIEFLPDSRFHPQETQTPRIAKARRLVVLSAGTFGSPVILERSGIGGAERLEKLGVDMVADLPGVGENYQGTHSSRYVGHYDLTNLRDRSPRCLHAVLRWRRSRYAGRPHAGET